MRFVGRVSPRDGTTLRRERRRSRRRRAAETRRGDALRPASPPAGARRTRARARLPARRHRFEPRRWRLFVQCHETRRVGDARRRLRRRRRRGGTARATPAPRTELPFPQIRPVRHPSRSVSERLPASHSSSVHPRTRPARVYPAPRRGRAAYRTPRATPRGRRSLRAIRDVAPARGRARQPLSGSRDTTRPGLRTHRPSSQRDESEKRPHRRRAGRWSRTPRRAMTEAVGGSELRP